MKLSQSSGQVNIRRKDALERLKSQLKLGTKTEKGTIITLATTGLNQIPLEEKDIKRIEVEISVLESKVISQESARATQTKKYRGVR